MRSSAGDARGQHRFVDSGVTAARVDKPTGSHGPTPSCVDRSAGRFVWLRVLTGSLSRSIASDVRRNSTITTSDTEPPVVVLHGLERRRTEVLEALLPDLRHRLALERQLQHGAPSSMLDAALDAIGRAALILDAHGQVADANVQAKELLASEGRHLRDELVAAMRPRAEHPRWSVTPVRLRGGGVEYLVLARTGNVGREALQVARASRAWGLTPRQCEVLAKVIDGCANQTIAAFLGLSERTVEVHVTALLEKAQVESRSALIANVYRLE